AGFGGLSDDTAAGAVARHNGPVERAGWRVATGRARFIRVLGGGSRSGQRPYRHDENWITDVILVEWLCMAL
ncbi:hypothetical protein FZI38_22435, partial [Cronobacter sakazakii]